MRDNGYAMSSNGVTDRGGDAVAAATRLLHQLILQQQPRRAAIAKNSPAALTERDAAAPSSPVRFYVPQLVDAEPAASTLFALARHNVVILSDSSSAVPQSSRVLRIAKDSPAHEPRVTLGETEALSLANILEQIDPTTDVVAVVIDASRFGPDAVLAPELDELRALLNAFFSVVRALHTGVAERKIRVGTLVCNAWDGAILNPLTGLFGGFIKSLQRDFPQAAVVAAVSDVALPLSLRFFETELGQDQREGALPEVFFRHGRRLREVLSPNSMPSSDRDPHLFAPTSVVLATGGARGVTAILLEDVLARYGCRVVALGRTDLDGISADVLAMDDAQLNAYETQYYQHAAMETPRQSPAEMKRHFARIVSANEVARTIARLNAAGGSFEYIRVDITDSTALEAVVADIYRRYGKVDVVMHGAGTQISKRLAKKTLPEFDLVVASKLLGLRNLFAAVGRHARSEPVDFHLLTSAFSFWGNDGQPDYGAANETLNRLAAAKTSSNGLRGNWSSLAWLAWPSIGMAKEFTWLGAARTLHPLRASEGQQLFAALTAFAPAHGSNILATPSEIHYFNVPISQTPTGVRALREELDLASSAAPYVDDHVVDGIPTMPGAAEFVIACRTALRLCPGMHIEALHNARFKSFLRRYADRPTNARVFARVLHEDSTGATVRIAICSDFVHHSGRVIKQNAEHFTADVACTRSVPDAPSFDDVVMHDADVRIDDPYISRLPALQLKGMFDCLREIALGTTHQFARLAIAPSVRTSPHRSMLITTLALDALARMGTMLRYDADVAICVPVAATSLTFYFDLRSDDLASLFDGARFVGMRPEPQADQTGILHMQRMWARTSTGRPLMQITRSAAKVQGMVPLRTLLSTPHH
jgi:NAD(P)-dependent dehydrogenase (short-subunit alcohol dehydrogenase family)